MKFIIPILLFVSTIYLFQLTVSQSILLFVAVLLGNWFMRVYQLTAQEIVRARVVKNNIIIKIKAETDMNGNTVLLVFNALTDQFMLQSVTIEEIVSQLRTQYENKNIFMTSNNKDGIEPLFIYEPTEITA